jgi:hypothetical protein
MIITTQKVTELTTVIIAAQEEQTTSVTYF